MYKSNPNLTVGICYYYQLVGLQLTILGSSGAMPAYGRFPSSQYLFIENHHFLIDCGEGTQMQLKRYSIPVHKIDRIFISHLHGDHYLGLTGLLFSMHLQKRTNDLHIYSQPGLDEIITLQLKHSRSSLNYKVVFHPILKEKSTCLFEDDKVSVTTIPLMHKISCTGFLFAEKEKPRRINKAVLPDGILLEHIAQLKSGKDVLNSDGSVLYQNKAYTLPPKHAYSYAYCSDTMYREQIVEQITGIDLLYHEATFMTEHEDKAAITLHSTAQQAALIARKANVKQLLMGHFSARYKELDLLLAGATAEFQNSRLATEGETIDLADL